MAERNLRSTVKVGTLGKWKTLTQMISIILLLISSSPSSGNYDTTHIETTSISLIQSILLSFGLVGFYFSTILTLISGYQYFYVAWPQLLSKRKEIIVVTENRNEIVKENNDENVNKANFFEG